MVTMPVTRRIPIVDRQFLPFSAEVIDLFVELERVKPSRRFADPRTKQLAALLGLMDQFWSVNFVNDIAGPPIPAGAREHWIRCRAVRAQLLEVINATALLN
jgi:hypothetical protein